MDDNNNIVSMEMDYETEETKDHGSSDETTIDENQVAEDNSDFVQEEQEELPARPTKWSKIKKEREEKFIISQELAAEKKRNAELEFALRNSVDTNSEHYSNYASELLDRAENQYATALEEGDAKAAAKAATAITQANMILNKAVSRPKYAEEIPSHIENMARLNPRGFASQKLMYDWVQDNPELNNNSYDFNPALAERVKPLIARLDAQLHERGQTDLMYSPQYFNVLDELITNAKTSGGSRNYLGPVRSRNYPTQRRGDRIVLTNDQKEAAAAFNMSEEKYANYLRKYQNEGN